MTRLRAWPVYLKPVSIESMKALTLKNDEESAMIEERTAGVTEELRQAVDHMEKRKVPCRLDKAVNRDHNMRVRRQRCQMRRMHSYLKREAEDAEHHVSLARTSISDTEAELSELRDV